MTVRMSNAVTDNYLDIIDYLVERSSHCLIGRFTDEK